MAPGRGWARVGLAVAIAISALVLGSILAVAVRAGTVGVLRPSDWVAVRFTLIQASLSALLSVGIAIPVARALARRRFPGRSLLVTLLGAPFILPVIVAILGLLMVFGRAGWLNSALDALDLPSVSIYGAHGVVLAHVFFNLPLAVRLILQGWLAIPAERFRLAASLGMTPAAVFRTIEWPMLRATLPGAGLVIFVVCASSFAVALALGGGPRATTIELAIYQAFRFDFDLGRAALLGVVQLAITAVAAVATFGIALPDAMGTGLDRVQRQWGGASGWGDAIVVGAATAFLLTPLMALILRGAPALMSLPASIWMAAGRSSITALGSAALCLALAVPLAIAIARAGRAARGIELAGMLGLAASPLVIGTGLFIMTFPFMAPSRLALPVTGLVNAILALPFALRALVPAIREIEAGYGRLAVSLGMPTGTWSRLVLLARLRRPIGFSAGLAAALSMGDLGVVALFAGSENATLPLQLYRLMAAYRMDEAAGAALLLLGLSLAAFWIFDRGGRVNADV